MIKIDYTPTSHKLTINEGLQESMDRHDLRTIQDRQAKRENESYRVHFDVSEKELKNLANDLLDRAYDAVRCRHDSVELEIDNNGGTIARCWDCGIDQTGKLESFDG